VAGGCDARHRFDAGRAESLEKGAHRRPVGGGAIEKVLEPKTHAHLAGALEVADLPGSQGGLLDLVRGLDLGQAVLALELADDLLAAAIVVRIGDGTSVGADAGRDDVDVIVVGVAVPNDDEGRAPVAEMFEVALCDVAPLRVGELLTPTWAVR